MLQGLSGWRATPPAIFAPLLGAIGLGVVWTRAGPVLGLGSGLGWVIFTVAVLIYIFFLGLYVAKLMWRMSSVLEDLRSVGSRAGLTALTLSAMLAASGLAPASPVAAEIVLFLALFGHTLLVVVFVRELCFGDRAIRIVTPVWHLIFVGFIVASQAAALLDYGRLALGILGATFLCALVIYGASVTTRRRHPLPPPMRPLLAVHLAPLSLCGTTALMLDFGVLGQVFALAATGIALALLLRLRWLIEAGFSPAWAAFTFPPVAYAGVLLMLSDIAAPYRWGGTAVLLMATIAVPVILARVLRLWASGALSEMTGAARA